MRVPKTPDITAQSRPLYEEFSSGDVVKQQTTEINTLIDGTRAALINFPRPYGRGIVSLD
ncbi:MAG: hypothetical protein ACSLEY_02875 [Candidatus Saccharimonadales bacterium]